ncbi:MAG: hypothetical protein WBK45_02820 [Tepidanaerobacteraceae bacterium]
MHKLNLLPKEILISQKKKKLGVFCIIAGSLLLILFIIFFTKVDNSIKLYENKIYVANKDISEMRSKLNYYFGQKTLRDFEKRQNFYNAAARDKTNYSAILTDIVNLLTDDINVSSISVNKSNIIKINGFTPGHKHVALLIDDLKTLDGVQEVTLGFTRLISTSDEEGSIGVYDFEISILLVKDRWQ